MTYEYCPRIEAAARAIAKSQGFALGEGAYSIFELPVAREWQYWLMAVAAIEAYAEAS